MRKKTIVSRGSFEGALTTARVIQQVVDATSTYLGTITLINVGLGRLTALALWWLGMPSPVMWGGIVAVANYIPYLGPIVCALLLFFGGLMTFPGCVGSASAAGDFHWLSPRRGELLHADGRRPSPDDQPAVDPYLTVVLGVGVGNDGRASRRSAAHHHENDFLGRGTPDIAGFLFEHGTLTHVGDEDEEEVEERQEMEPAMVDTPKALS